METLNDALWTLQQSDIEYLYPPEYGKLLTTKELIQGKQTMNKVFYILGSNQRSQ